MSMKQKESCGLTGQEETENHGSVHTDGTGGTQEAQPG